MKHALRPGIPLIVAGLSEEKAEIAARLAWSGVRIKLALEHAVPNSSTVGDPGGAGPAAVSRMPAISREFDRYDAKSEVCRLVDKVVTAR